MPDFKLTTDRLIANFLNNKNEKNAVALHERLSQTSYFVPLLRGESEVVSPDDLSGLELQLIPLKERFMVLPVFTDAPFMRNYHSAPSFVELTMPQLYRLLEERPDISYLLLNPDNHAISFDRSSFLDSFGSKEARVKIAREEFEKGDMLNFTSVPASTCKKGIAALQAAAAEFPEISRIWIAEQNDATVDQPVLFFVFECSEQDLQRYTPVLQSFLKAEHRRAARAAFSDTEAAAGIVDHFEPVYTRKAPQA
ncbi:enhanced serine sensitivity protein SseB C-terminal domain-containing protein [Allobaculum mucilyticum]|uniref:enhanced serine sensitivity protein SseB C-terminal domain-containing protein n=1 Tax=Allobaculum mucilyticum TaxID=2834459 RepID=UPI001E620CEB|nr:enhanced serine sensitivity protein SseB C-terminal domain-containing protein [Allobaculum mucilyticum]UNT95762.1 SseB family protein [Allobaculum mucilyticum]